MLHSARQASPQAERESRRSQDEDDRLEQTRPPRRKRAKYTAVACNECKKRKIKCSGEPVCPRCARIGLHCEYAGASHRDDSEPTDKMQLVAIEGVVSGLQKQMDLLVASVRQIKDCSSALSRPGASTDAAEPSVRQNTLKRKEPHFLGPTNPAFSFNLARSSLESMGIQTKNGDTELRIESLAPSQRESPEPLAFNRSDVVDPLCQISEAEVIRLTEVYKADLAPIYPFVDVEDIQSQVPMLYRQLQDNTTRLLPACDNSQQDSAHDQEIKILKLVVASALVLECSGRSSLGQRLVDTLTTKNESLWELEVDIRELQILTLRSIYYFHRDEEVLAWRAIGVACRMSLEMGLHRTVTLMSKYPDPKKRVWVLRLFWSIYVLDRRWSFGTGMPFALHDSDLDPELPTNLENPYLECLITYGRLSSKVWNAVASYGAVSKGVNKDTIAYLDFQIQQWIAAIPPDLQVVNVQTGEALVNDNSPSSLLGVFLHLRGNHLRMLIHRQNVISTTNIMKNIRGAQHVTEIARNTISVLVRVNETSELYTTQQNAFSYFLVSALAAIFLAVCHAPAEFAHVCRHEYYSALDLVKSFSARSSISRRLWKSVRDLKQIAPHLGLKLQSHGASHAISKDEASISNLSVKTRPTPGFTAARNAPRQADVYPHEQLDSGHADMLDDYQGPASVVSASTNTQPDFMQMSNDLTEFFEAFGQDSLGNHEPDAESASRMEPRYWETNFAPKHADEIARLFNDLF